MQSDIIAPLPDALPDAHSARTAGELYTASGTHLLILNLTTTIDTTTGNTMLTPPQRFDLLPYEEFTNRTIELENVDTPKAAPVKVACGLRDTFRVRTLLLLEHHNASDPVRRLLIIGTATECTGVHSGVANEKDNRQSASRVRLAESLTPTDATTGDVYENPAFRPFNSTVAIVVDVTLPGNPRLIGAVQYEGILERVHPERTSVWLFLEQQTHPPFLKEGAVAKGVSAPLVDAEVMPFYRTQIQGQDGRWSWTPFAVVAKCADVHVLENEGPPISTGSLLAVVPLPLFGNTAGTSEPKNHRLYLGSWHGQVRALGGLCQSKQCAAFLEVMHTNTCSSSGGGQTMGHC
jgi:hypothetical protein